MPPRRTTSARRNAATQTPAEGDDNKEKSVRDVEARLEAERRLTEELRQEVALLKDQERDARSDADALRTGLDTIRDGAARLARRCDDLADAAKKQRDDNAKAHRVRELEGEVARLAKELETARAETARAADGAAKTDLSVPSSPFESLAGTLSESLAAMSAALEDAKERSARTLAELDEEKALDAAARADGGPAAAPAATEETEPTTAAPEPAATAQPAAATEEAEPTTAAPEPAATAELAPEPASTTAADISARPCRTLDDQYASMAERLSNLNRMADEALARQEEYLARN